MQIEQEIQKNIKVKLSKTPKLTVKLHKFTGSIAF